MNRLIAIFCLFGISASLAERLQGEGVILGDDTEENQFPYQVALISGNNVICGGGIIDDYHILTAAHCVTEKDGKYNGKQLTAVAGTVDIVRNFAEGVVVPVERAYVPKEFTGRSSDFNVFVTSDIAVLRLSKSLNLRGNTQLKALKLPTSHKETFDDKYAKIAGFGYDWVKVVEDPNTGELKEFGGSSSSKLKYVNSKVYNAAECQLTWGPSQKLDGSHLCAKAWYRDRLQPFGICTGDTGGPLVYNGDVVIGVASVRPVGCREFTIPVVYTRVSSFLTFIQRAQSDEVTEFMRVYYY